MQTLEELEGDKSLERFRLEYEKLHTALKKSHEGERKLIKKCRELNQEIVSNADKVQTALKLSEEDQSTIASLKKEIEKAWTTVDSSQEKEAEAKETIQQLKSEIANLSKLIEEGAGQSHGQEKTVNELLKAKEELANERDEQVSQVQSLRQEVQDLQERLNAVESDKNELEQEVYQLRDNVQTKKGEVDREQRKKERIEREMKELKQALEARNNEMQQKQETIDNGEQHVSRLESALKEQRAATEKAQHDYSAISDRVQKLQKDLDEQIHHNTQLEADNNDKQGQLKVKDDEIQQVKMETVRMNKLRENMQNKVKRLEKQKADVETQRDELRNEVQSLEQEITSYKKSQEQERRRGDELTRERNILNRLKTKEQKKTQEQKELVIQGENTKTSLEHEIQGYKKEAQNQQKTMTQLEREREKYSKEASEANEKLQQAYAEIKKRDITITDIQEKVSEAESRLKQQQNLYEAIRSDRNLYSKNLIKAQDEMREMKRKYKVLNHQVDQLKGEISQKDLALVKEHFDHKKVEKEKESLKFQLNNAKQQTQEAEATISSKKSEIAKLNHIINEADQERLRQKKEYDTVVNDRDILGTQLIRRNDELALLYEKIKIQQSTLNKGQIQYRERLNEIRALKIKLNDLRRELGVMKSSVPDMDVLKREVHHLGRELLQERTKVKALSDELENPINVHRWRKLEGSDPSAYEMIQKTQTLQKRLIAKTEEAVEKDLKIQEKEKQSAELKKILSRQPGPEVAEQLSSYQQSLKDRTKQMKSITSERNMYQAQVSEYKYEIDRLNRELADMKRKYCDKKRKEQRQQQTQHIEPSWLEQEQQGLQLAPLRR
jgi:chromosome segregation ATPase